MGCCCGANAKPKGKPLAPPPEELKKRTQEPSQAVAPSVSSPSPVAARVEKHRRQPIFAMIAERKLQELRDFLAKKSSLDVLGMRGWHEEVKVIAEHTDTFNWNPVLYAIWNAFPEAVKLLLEMNGEQNLHRRLFLRKRPDNNYLVRKD